MLVYRYARDQAAGHRQLANIVAETLDPRHSLAAAVMQYLEGYVAQFLPTEVEDVKPDTPLFWSTYGQRCQGLVRRPMEGKNIWRLCKTQIGESARRLE